MPGPGASEMPSVWDVEPSEAYENFPREDKEELWAFCHWAGDVTLEGMPYHGDRGLERGRHGGEI